MNNTKSTKRALLSSIMAMLICVAMLIGTTFAWFTDSASTAVNKIQAGTLKIELQYATAWDASGNPTAWDDAEGKTLNFLQKQADGTVAQGTNILWEPGCTYELPQLRVVNKGDLALKYKVIISGINGSAKLNEVIDWTINDAPINLTEKHLLAGQTDDPFTIKGQMQETAGNEYQGLSIDGIGITVVATQDTVEADSFGDQYDINAVYPVAPTLSNTTVAGTIKSDENTTLGNMSDTGSPTSAEITIPSGAVDTDTNAVFNMNLTDLRPDSVTYEISLKDTTGNSVTLDSPAKVTTNIGANLTNVVVKHSNNLMTKVTSTNNLTDGTYYYKKSTGELIICSSTFSPFEISYEFDGAASLNGVAYPSIYTAINAANDGDTIVLMKDYTTMWYDSIKNKKITIDLNGKTWNYNNGYYQAIQVLDNADLTIKNGTIKSANYGILVRGDGDKLTLDNVKLETKATNGIGVFGNSNNSTVVIKNSEINSNYIGVYQNGSFGGNTYQITNTKITDTFGLGVYISNSASKAKQNLTIDNCVISGPSGVEIKHTNATITNSTLIGTSTPTGSGVNGNGTCTDGYAFAATTNGVNDYVTGNVSVSSCKFYSGSTTEGDPNGYVFVYKVAEGSSVTIDGNTVTEYNTYGGEVSESNSEE